MKAKATPFFKTLAGLFMAAVMVVASLPVAPASAFTSGAKVSFTFDDGLASSMLAAETLQPFDYSGTQYVITDCVGKTAPNDCNDSENYNFLTWQQIGQLKNNYGWEIGSHTVSHPHMPQISTDQAKAELTESYETLKSNGFEPTAFAFPYGEYNDALLAEAGKVYSSVRRFEDAGANTYPYNDNLIMIKGVQAGDSVDDRITVDKVKGYVDEAITNGHWLVLVFHEIVQTNPSTWEYTANELQQIAAYVQSKNLPVVNMTDGIVRSNTNLLPNGGFDNGLADGWTTDSDSIVADSNGNGSYPNPTHSIFITAATSGNTHLFSPQVDVNFADTYVIKSFVNVTAINGGSIGYYIDEYDAAGTWISGQDKSAVASIKATDTPKAKALNFTYKPSSAAVAKARLEVVVNGASGIKAYVDNFQWFPESTIIGGTFTPPAPKAGDVNGDSVIDALDLSTVLANWSKTGQSQAQGDLNADGTVDALDLSTVLSNWSN